MTREEQERMIAISEQGELSEELKAMLTGMSPNDIYQLGYANCYFQFKKALMPAPNPIPVFHNEYKCPLCGAYFAGEMMQFADLDEFCACQGATIGSFVPVTEKVAKQEESWLEKAVNDARGRNNPPSKPTTWSHETDCPRCGCPADVHHALGGCPHCECSLSQSCIEELNSPA